MNAEKTDGKLNVGAVNCCIGIAAENMMNTKYRYDKMDGRTAYHLIFSLPEGYNNTNMLMEVMEEYTRRLLENKYEAVYAVHNDTNNLHGHLIFNSVSCKDGNKFHYKKTEWADTMVRIANDICVKYGLPILDLSGDKETIKSESYIEWLKHKQGFKTWKDMIKADIDAAVNIAYSWGNFKVVMENMGYEIKDSGKYATITPYGEQGIKDKERKAHRLTRKTLGIGYSEEDILARIDGATFEKPKRTQVKKKYTTKHKVDWNKIKGKGHRIYTTYQLSYLRYVKALSGEKKRTYGKQTMAQKREITKTITQIEYMFNNGIRDKAALMKRFTDIGTETYKLNKERRNLKYDRRNEAPIHEAARKVRFYQRAHELYEQGLLFYGAENREYEKAVAYLAKRKCTVEEADAMREKRANKMMDLRKEILKLEKEKNIINGILYDESKVKAKTNMDKTAYTPKKKEREHTKD